MLSSPDPGYRPEATTPVTLDRRRQVRYESSLHANCHLDAPMPQPSWPALVRNLSVGGIGLLLSHRFRPGTHLVVQLRNPNGSLRRTLRVRVRHATAMPASDPAAWYLGCSFASCLSEGELRDLLGDCVGASARPGSAD